MAKKMSGGAKSVSSMVGKSKVIKSGPLTGANPSKGSKPKGGRTATG